MKWIFHYIKDINITNLLHSVEFPTTSWLIIMEDISKYVIARNIHMVSLENNNTCNQTQINFNFDALYSIMQSYHFQWGNKQIPSSLQIT